MTTLPGAEGSRVVLIGVSTYQDDVFPDVPGVANNVAELRRLFTDPEVWGLPEENVVRVDERANASEVLDRVHTAASEASEALVVYFAGHGLADRAGLRLMLSGSSPSRPWTGLPYGEIRSVLLDHGSPASWKTVILDCCFAGAAFDGTLSATDRFTDLAAVRGTCLLTACGETEFAWAPPKERYTAFSGELIRILGQGVAGGPEFLDVEALYHGTRTGLRAIGGPVPQRRVHEDGGRAVLGRNRAWRPVTQAPRPPAPMRTSTAPGLRREGIDVHIQVREEGCHGIAGDIAFFETDRALIGVDLRGGAVAWARPLGEDEPFLHNNCLQAFTEAGTSVIDPRTGTDAFRWKTGDGRVGLAMVTLPGVTFMAELDDVGDDVHRLAGRSPENGTPIWELPGPFDDPAGFVADDAGRPAAMITGDANGRIVRIDLRDGSTRDTGIASPGAIPSDVTGDGLLWTLTPEGVLTVTSLADASTRVRLDGFGLRGLGTPLAFHSRGEVNQFLKNPMVYEMIFIDAESRAAAVWLDRDNLRAVVLGSPDEVVERYGEHRTILGWDGDRHVTRVHDREGRLVGTHERLFWRLDASTAISAPLLPPEEGVPFTTRVALLDVPTGRVTELGTVTTLGNAVWSRTHLVAPTADGVRVWRYRD